jgi:hypothetical protein
MRRRKHRKEVAASLERDVSRLTAEYKSLRAANEELRTEWDECQQQPRASSQANCVSLVLPQNIPDVRSLATHMASSPPLPHMPRSFLDPSATGFQRSYQEQQQRTLTFMTSLPGTSIEVVQLLVSGSCVLCVRLCSLSWPLWEYLLYVMWLRCYEPEWNSYNAT